MDRTLYVFRTVVNAFKNFKSHKNEEFLRQKLLNIPECEGLDFSNPDFIYAICNGWIFLKDAYEDSINAEAFKEWSNIMCDNWPFAKKIVFLLEYSKNASIKSIIVNYLRPKYSIKSHIDCALAEIQKLKNKIEPSDLLVDIQHLDHMDEDWSIIGDIISLQSSRYYWINADAFICRAKKWLSNNGFS